MAKMKPKKKDKVIFIPSIPVDKLSPMPPNAKRAFLLEHSKKVKKPFELEFEDPYNFIDLCEKFQMTPGQMVGLIMRLLILGSKNTK